MNERGGARLLRLTALGGVVLVAIVRSKAAGIPALVLMLGPGVAVPLGLAIALDRESPTPFPGAGLPRRMLLSAAPMAAAAAVLGWLVPPGDPIAIASASLYAVTCSLAGLAALVRLWSRRRDRFLPLPEIAIDVGSLLLPVAGVWFLASRSAMPLIGFEEPVVTFTAAHFHFAGFAAPTIIGGVGRLLAEEEGRSKSSRVRYVVAAAAICLGVPLTAIGIATNHTVESIAAVVLACGMLVAATVLVLNASRQASRRAPYGKLAALLFVVSGVTLLLTMTLAATFALTSSAGRGSSLQGVVPLQTMIDWHGGANALGFALPALLALTLTIRPRLRP